LHAADGDHADSRSGSGPPERRLRLFVALDLPDAVRDALAALRPDPDVWRRVKPEALHVTLAFLGSRPASDVDLIRPLIVPSPAPPLALGPVLLLPPRRARVLTVEVADPTGALAQLQARVSAGLETARVYTPEKRPFRAHVTIARLRPRVRPPREAHLDIEPLQFAGQAVTLYVSRLHPSGARYETLASARL
jgi:2'-5' RNA ligase